MTSLLTVTEAAERLRKSTRFVKDEIKRKNLRASFYGRQWHVTPEAIDAYIAAHMNVREVKRTAS